jgi:hypothetical protein
MRRNIKISVLAVCISICFSVPLFASRNPSCISQVTAKVLSADERAEQVEISPTETETDYIIYLEAEIVSVDTAPECGYKAGQKIKTTLVRGDANTGNRIRKDAVIKTGTVLKGGFEYVADEFSSGYGFEGITEVINQ